MNLDEKGDVKHNVNDDGVRRKTKGYDFAKNHNTIIVDP